MVSFCYCPVARQTPHPLRHGDLNEYCTFLSVAVNLCIGLFYILNVHAIVKHCLPLGNMLTYYANQLCTHHCHAWIVIYMCQGREAYITNKQNLNWNLNIFATMYYLTRRFPMWVYITYNYILSIYKSMVLKYNIQITCISQP